MHVDEAESATRAQLERVRACVADAQWDEAVETLRRIMENPAGKLMLIAENRYVSLGDYCQAQIAALPPPGLKLYRERVDSLAERSYREGIAQRDRARLENGLSHFFASSWGDKSLLALGEIALEEGRHAAARSYWEAMLEHPPQVIAAAKFDFAHAAAERAEHAGAPGAEADLALVDRWYAIDRSPDPPTYRLRTELPLGDDDSAALTRFWKVAGLAPSTLSYPGTTVPLADIRARLILASIGEGGLERAAGELSAFERLHSNAAGHLAGRDGNYVATLKALLAEAAHWPAEPVSPDWPTFAGSPERNKVVDSPLELGAQAWPPIELGEPQTADVANMRMFSLRRVAEDAQGLLSYHPIVVGDLILVAKQTQLFAFNLYTGKPAWPGGGAAHAPGEFFSDDLPVHAVRLNRGLGVPRYTLTAHEGRLYARTGSQVTSHPLDSQESAGGHLACFDLTSQGLLLWKISPDDDRWSFGGSPVVAGANVYITMRKSDVRPQEHIACFDAQTGKRRWRTMICAAETPGGGQEEMSHNLLTLAEGTLYANTNLGAVAAIRPEDGSLKWVSLYRRASRTAQGQDRRAAHFYRDLTPAMFRRGALLVAPADCESIFALDSGSGQMIWESHLAEDAVHLLGVGGGALIASGDRLWWIDATGGKVLDNWPSETPHGFGRGVLAGGRVYWPTREFLYVFNQRIPPRTHATMVRDPIALAAGRGASGGNLIPADGVLLVATANKLYGFRQPGGPADALRKASRAAGARAPPPAAAESVPVEPKARF